MDTLELPPELSASIGKMRTQAENGLQETLDRMVAAGGKPQWRQWFADVLVKLKDKPYALQGVVDLLDRAEAAESPTERARKGVGELAEPNGFLVKNLTELCKRFNVRWGPFPEQTKTGPKRVGAA